MRKSGGQTEWRRLRGGAVHLFAPGDVNSACGLALASLTEPAPGARVRCALCAAKLKRHRRLFEEALR